MFGELPNSRERSLCSEPENDVLAAKDVITTDNDLSPAKTIMMALI